MTINKLCTIVHVVLKCKVEPDMETRIRHLSMGGVVNGLKNFRSGIEPVDNYCQLLACVLGQGWKSSTGFAMLVNQSLEIIAMQELEGTNPKWGKGRNCDVIRDALPEIFKNYMPHAFAEEVITQVAQGHLN